MYEKENCWPLPLTSLQNDGVQFTGPGSGQQTEHLPDELREIWIIFLLIHLFSLLHLLLLWLPQFFKAVLLDNLLNCVLTL